VQFPREFEDWRADEYILLHGLALLLDLLETLDFLELFTPPRIASNRCVFTLLGERGTPKDRPLWSLVSFNLESSCNRESHSGEAELGDCW